MKTNTLENLEKIYQSYAPFWEDWKLYPFNGLSQTDVYILDVHISNEFQLDINLLAMFFNQSRVIADLITTLNQTYEKFQDWLMLKFQYSILKFANGIQPEVFLRLPLDLLEDNKYGIFTPLELNTLLKFKCETLGEVFNTFSKDRLRHQESFCIAVEFLAVLKIEKTIYLTLKKEVAFINGGSALN